MKLTQILIGSSLLVGCTGESNLGNTTQSTVPPPSTRWAVSFGGDDTDEVWNLKLDSVGDVLATGEAEGHSGIDSELALESKYSFITKRAAADGSELWRVRLGIISGDPNGGVKIADAAVDTHDNIIALIRVYSSVGSSRADLGGVSVDIQGSADSSSKLAYVVKYSSTGQLVWAKPLAIGTSPSNISLDGSDRIVVTGTALPGTSTIAGTTYVNRTPGAGSYPGDPVHEPGQTLIAAFDSELVPRWRHILQATDQTGANRPTGLAVMSNGDVAVTGSVPLPARQWDDEALVHPAVLTIGAMPVQHGSSTYITRLSEDGAFQSTVELDHPETSPTASVYVWNPLRAMNDQLAFNVGQSFDPYHVTYETRFVDEALTLAATTDLGPRGDLTELVFDGSRVLGVEHRNREDGTPALYLFTIGENHQRTDAAPFGELILGAEGTNESVGYFFGPSAVSADTLVFGGRLGATFDFGTGPMTSHDANGDALIVALDNSNH
ncbi:hypothetical protein BH11MYX2_BH11MYX2_34490 [soil metagenome]